MKKWFTLSLAMVAAAVSQAVTVAWMVPTSGSTTAGNETSAAYAWTGNIAKMKLVYSTTELNAEQAYAIASQGNGSKTVEVGGTEYSGTVYQPQGAVQTFKTESSSTTALTVWANNVAPTHTHTLDQTGSVTSQLYFGSGAYYYLVVQSGDDEPLYAVAGTGTKITDDNAEMYGIYGNLAGEIPDAHDYFDGLTWLGGTWTAAQVPEPTVLALLALGVAGVALRRKQNFTK